MRPYAPIPRFVADDHHASLLQRLLLSDLPPTIRRIDFVTTSFLRASLVDTGLEPPIHTAEGDTELHVLWQPNDTPGWLEIEGDRHALVPGDTACIPQGEQWCVSPNQVLVQIVSRTRGLTLPVLPHHGMESFHGYNRLTRFESASIHRWKLTESLTLPDSNSDTVLIGLYQPIALQWAHGVDLLPQGGCRVIRAQSGAVTLVPNGLSYVLTV